MLLKQKVNGFKTNQIWGMWPNYATTKEMLQQVNPFAKSDKGMHQIK
jgi:hypothetical protein